MTDTAEQFLNNYRRGRRQATQTKCIPTQVQASTKEIGLMMRNFT